MNDSKVWSKVDSIFVEDCRRHRLEFQSFAMQLLCSCSYREFFQQDDEYGFDETGTDQIVLNLLGISESVYSNDLCDCDLCLLLYGDYL